MRERAFSDLADPARGAARINNIGSTHDFSPEASDCGARRRHFDLLVTAGAVKGTLHATWRDKEGQVSDAISLSVVLRILPM